MWKRHLAGCRALHHPGLPRRKSTHPEVCWDWESASTSWSPKTMPTCVPMCVTCLGLIATDSATAVIGAKFGAFFYNLVDDQGERFAPYKPLGRAARSV
jgi:hypothetical protein